MADISYEDLLVNRIQATKIKGRMSLKQYCLTDTGDEEENKRRKRLLEEYSSKNKISIKKIAYASHKKVLWKCQECGYEWEARIDGRTGKDKSGCGRCSGRFVSQKNSLLSFIEKSGAYGRKLRKEYSPKNELGLEEVPYSTAKKVLWKCSICKKEWWARIDHRTREKSGCPHCNKIGTSFPEQLIFYILKRELHTHEVFNRDKSEGREIDVFIPSLKFGVEYDGWLYHKDKQEEDNKKHQYFKDRDLDIIRIIGKENDELTGASCNLEYNITKDTELLEAREYIKNYLSEHYNIKIDVSMTGDEIEECKREARKQIEDTLGGFDIEGLDIVEDEESEETFEYLPAYL